MGLGQTNNFNTFKNESDNDNSNPSEEEDNKVKQKDFELDTQGHANKEDGVLDQEWQHTSKEQEVRERTSLIYSKNPESSEESSDRSSNTLENKEIEEFAENEQFLKGDLIDFNLLDTQNIVDASPGNSFSDKRTVFKLNKFSEPDVGERFREKLSPNSTKQDLGIILGGPVDCHLNSPFSKEDYSKRTGLGTSKNSGNSPRGKDPVIQSIYQYDSLKSNQTESGKIKSGNSSNQYESLNWKDKDTKSNHRRREEVSLKTSDLTDNQFSDITVTHKNMGFYPSQDMIIEERTHEGDSSSQFRVDSSLDIHIRTGETKANGVPLVNTCQSMNMQRRGLVSVEGFNLPGLSRTQAPITKEQLGFIGESSPVSSEDAPKLCSNSLTQTQMMNLSQQTGQKINAEELDCSELVDLRISKKSELTESRSEFKSTLQTKSHFKLTLRENLFSEVFEQSGEDSKGHSHSSTGSNFPSEESLDEALEEISTLSNSKSEQCLDYKSNDKHLTNPTSVKSLTHSKCETLNDLVNNTNKFEFEGKDKGKEKEKGSSQKNEEEGKSQKSGEIYNQSLNWMESINSNEKIEDLASPNLLERTEDLLEFNKQELDRMMLINIQKSKENIERHLKIMDSATGQTSLKIGQQTLLSAQEEFDPLSERPSNTDLDARKLRPLGTFELQGDSPKKELFVTGVGPKKSNTNKWVKIKSESSEEEGISKKDILSGLNPKLATLVESERIENSILKEVHTNKDLQIGLTQGFTGPNAEGVSNKGSIRMEDSSEGVPSHKPIDGRPILQTRKITVGTSEMKKEFDLGVEDEDEDEPSHKPQIKVSLYNHFVESNFDDYLSSQVNKSEVQELAQELISGGKAIDAYNTFSEKLGKTTCKKATAVNGLLQSDFLEVNHKLNIVTNTFSSLSKDKTAHLLSSVNQHNKEEPQQPYANVSKMDKKLDDLVNLVFEESHQHKLDSGDTQERVCSVQPSLQLQNKKEDWTEFLRDLQYEPNSKHQQSKAGKNIFEVNRIEESLGRDLVMSHDIDPREARSQFKMSGTEFKANFGSFGITDGKSDNQEPESKETNFQQAKHSVKFYESGGEPEEDEPESLEKSPREFYSQNVSRVSKTDKKTSSMRLKRDFDKKESTQEDVIARIERGFKDSNDGSLDTDSQSETGNEEPIQLERIQEESRLREFDQMVSRDLKWAKQEKGLSSKPGWLPDQFGSQRDNQKGLTEEINNRLDQFLEDNADQSKNFHLDDSSELNKKSNQNSNADYLASNESFNEFAEEPGDFTYQSTDQEQSIKVNVLKGIFKGEALVSQSPQKKSVDSGEQETTSTEDFMERSHPTKTSQSKFINVSSNTQERETNQTSGTFWDSKGLGILKFTKGRQDTDNSKQMRKLIYDRFDSRGRENARGLATQNQQLIQTKLDLETEVRDLQLVLTHIQNKSLRMQIRNSRLVEQMDTLFQSDLSPLFLQDIRQMKEAQMKEASFQSDHNSNVEQKNKVLQRKQSGGHELSINPQPNLWDKKTSPHLSECKIII